jgi:hypothetical protein
VEPADPAGRQNDGLSGDDDGDSCRDLQTSASAVPFSSLVSRPRRRTRVTGCSDSAPRP